MTTTKRTPTSIPGLYEYRTAGGKRVYHAKFKCNGRLVQARLSSDKKAAASMLRELKLRAEREQLGLETVQRDYPLKELVGKFLSYVELHRRPSSLKAYECDLRLALEILGPVKLSDLTPDSAQMLLREFRSRGLSPRTANKRMNAISTVINWARRHGMVKSNPWEYVQRLSEDVKYKRRAPMRSEEIRSFMTAAEEPWRTIWKIILYTGMRRNEMTCLKVDDIDFENRMICIRADIAKGKRDRFIPIHEEIEADLKRLVEEREEGLLFVTERGTPRVNNLMRKFRKTLVKAGLPDDGRFDIHGFRSTLASSLARARVPIHVVQRILGHASVTTTMKHYVHVIDGDQETAMKSLSYKPRAEKSSKLKDVRHAQTG